MRVLKYFGAAVSALLSLSMITPVYFLVNGLLTVEVKDPAHFILKLLLEIAMMAGLALLAVYLFRSARRDKQ